MKHLFSWIGAATVFGGAGLASLNANAACEPFSLEVAQTGAMRGGPSRGGGPPEQTVLKWAQATASDSTFVYSDSPFYMATGRDGGSHSWNLDAPDSELSQDNTLLEIYGYLKNWLGASIEPKTFLVEQNRRVFDGLGVLDLQRYRGPNDKVDRAISAVFGDKAPALLKQMAAQNSDRRKFGVPFFNRPSYLTSPSTTEKVGQGIPLMCMAIAYGQDYFTNVHLAKIADPVERERRREASHREGFQIAFRSSVVDAAAAAALEASKATGKPATTKFKIANKLDCDLVKSQNFSLLKIEALCPTKEEMITQKYPVVRRGPDYEESSRFVQVGQDLYEVECKAGDKTINLSTDRAVGSADLSAMIKTVTEGDKAFFDADNDLAKNVSRTADFLVELGDKGMPQLMADRKTTFAATDKMVRTAADQCYKTLSAQAGADAGSATQGAGKASGTEAK